MNVWGGMQIAHGVEISLHGLRQFLVAQLTDRLSPEVWLLYFCAASPGGFEGKSVFTLGVMDSFIITLMLGRHPSTWVTYSN